MLPQLTKYLIENWKTIFPGKENPSKIDFLGILGSHEGGKISFLVFIDNEKPPAFIIKILRNNNFIKRFLNERDVLLYLNSLDDFFKDSVPKVILCKEINDIWILVESILDGKAMEVHLAKDGLPDLKETEVNFNLVKDWLIEFNLRTKREILISNDFIENYIIKQIKKSQEIFTFDELEKDYLKRILDEIADHKGETINLFFRHGDFCRHNILIKDSKIKLIDWEFSQRDSPPLYDIFYFLILYYQQLINSGKISDRVDCFRRTFFEENDYSYLVYRFVMDHCEKLKIKKSLIEIFFLALLLERTIFEYQNLLELSERGFIPFLEIMDKQDKDYLERIKNQLWVNFFRFAVKNEDKLIFK